MGLERGALLLQQALGVQDRLCGPERDRLCQEESHGVPWAARRVGAPERPGELVREFECCGVCTFAKFLSADFAEQGNLS